MKNIYFLLASTVITFSSCSVYKNTQTPDDVYYSPGNSNTPAAVNNNQNNQDEYYNTGASDQYVQMRVQNPARWSYFDDYNYNYDPYSPMGFGSYGSYGTGLGFGYGMGFGSMGGFGYYNPFSFWNSYYAWNNYYNPYYGNLIVFSPKSPSSNVYPRLRPFNAGGYSNSNYRGGSNTRPNSYNNYSQSYRPTTNNRSSQYGRTYSTPNSNQSTRSYSPSSFSSGSGGGSRSSGGGSGGGGGGMSRPGRR